MHLRLGWQYSICVLGFGKVTESLPQVQKPEPQNELPRHCSLSVHCSPIKATANSFAAIIRVTVHIEKIRLISKPIQ